MAKRGRPRKTGPRTPTGRLSRKADKGTPQLQQIRAWLAQGDQPEDGSLPKPGNPDLTSYPLGILLANDQITEEQHRHACHYAWLHAVVFGRVSTAAMSWERTDRGHEGEWNDEWLEKVTAELYGCSAIFEAEPAALRSIVDGVVVYERVPRFLKPVFSRASDIREAELLQHGITLLERHFGRMSQRVANAA